MCKYRDCENKPVVLVSVEIVRKMSFMQIILSQKSTTSKAENNSLWYLLIYKREVYLPTGDT